MGDRGNIKIGGVWFYTHWGGTDIKRSLQKSLAKKLRWQDEAYLARIIFDDLTEGCHGEEIGFGISTGMCDNEHNILEVDVDKQEVRELRADFNTKLSEVNTGKLPVVMAWNFERFIELEDSKLDLIE